mmetsp:Transcript_9530/g.21887  ORF Transcript_9530/g.21887 Transcript_9530/m.21887 type:complete len:87 (+) Transcript_9530:1137-1397(+)
MLLEKLLFPADTMQHGILFAKFAGQMFEDGHSTPSDNMEKFMTDALTLGHQLVQDIWTIKSIFDTKIHDLLNTEEMCAAVVGLVLL